MQKSVLKQVESVLSTMTLEERLKNPVYLKLVCAKANAKMNIITTHIPGYHIVTSLTGHFGPKGGREYQQCAS